MKVLFLRIVAIQSLVSRDCYYQTCDFRIPVVLLILLYKGNGVIISVPSDLNNFISKHSEVIIILTEKGEKYVCLNS